MRLIVGLTLASWLCLGCLTAHQAADLEIVHIASEGFLLAVDDRKVLIDAFVQQPYSIYPSAPDLVEAMIEGRAPFDGVDVALVSHHHRDHFQRAAASAVLAGQPEMTLVTSPQVVSQLAPRSRIVTRLPEPGQWDRWSGHDVRVDLMRLPHSGETRKETVQNLGHLVSIDGFTILHVGDAAMSIEHFAAYGLDEIDLDVALIPYWYFSTADGREIVERFMNARLQIAVHIPMANEDVAGVSAARDTGIEMALTPLQSWRVPRTAR